MNGAESLIRTAVNAGLEICFANPGTAEMPRMVALDEAPVMHGVLGLFEGGLARERPTATGAALGCLAQGHRARSGWL